MTEAFITEAGRYPELSAEDYHADPVVGGSLSSTGARRILPPDGCPAKFDYERRHPRPHKPYFDFGHAAHRAVLGAGETIEVIEAKDWRTKAAKAQRDKAHEAGKTPILAHDHDKVLAMADALRSHPEASALLAAGHGQPEQSIVWCDDHTGVTCRARFDWLPDPIGGRRVAIPDYKTCESASRDACNRAISQHGYHQQGALYLAGARALGLADTGTHFRLHLPREDPALHRDHDHARPSRPQARRRPEPVGSRNVRALHSKRPMARVRRRDHRDAATALGPQPSRKRRSALTLAPTTPAAPAPATLGQATAIEQSRAVAEVQAAVLVAQHNRRSMSAARASLAESCAMLRFADTAFFRYPRGDKTISGPSVHMARELARCFRNVTYGIVELRRDDLAGESEMMAFAWDLEANTRSTTTFIVPHKRDVNGQMRQLTQLRDVYENNANMGARRVREMIFAILPPYFTSEAVELCEATLERGDGNRTLEERAQAAVDVFAPLGVTQDRLEQKLGRTIDKWTGYDLAQLRITHRSIERRELTVEDEFPAPRLTVADLTPEAPAPISEPPAAEPEATPETPDEPEATSETPAEPAVPVTGPELREIITVHKGRDVTVPKALRAVQAQFPDAGLVEVDAIAADPQALDWLLGWIDRGGK